MPDDLLAFVTARLDDEEQLAQAACEMDEDRETAGQWHTGAPSTPIAQVLVESASDGPWRDPVCAAEQADAAHIAAQDPRATLDRVAALRAVVAMHRSAPLDETDDACTECGSGTDIVAWPCPTLRALASAWRSHPDWRERWAAEGVGADA